MRERAGRSQGIEISPNEGTYEEKWRPTTPTPVPGQNASSS